jgi:hypothetical protein
VIKHRNDTLKSTPFQAVFSEKALKNRDSKKTRNKDLSLYVNDQLVDLPMRIDPNSGRVQFQKVTNQSSRNMSEKLAPFLIPQTSQMTNASPTAPPPRNAGYQAPISKARASRNSRISKYQKIFGSSPGSSTPSGKLHLLLLWRKSKKRKRRESSRN